MVLVILSIGVGYGLELDIGMTGKSTSESFCSIVHSAYENITPEGR